jgi:ribosomal protein S18 acetylase RimI-like enzyme
VEDLLNNPVYHALCSGDAPLSLGSGLVKYFDEEVSPFAGFPEGYDKGFDNLYELLPRGRGILYATPGAFEEPPGWQLQVAVRGLQFIFDITRKIEKPAFGPLPLSKDHVDAMLALTALTKPGPFGPRTIEFGHYYGIFEKEQLVAMTGQRLHVSNYAEISAVCTHPDHLGNGYAAALILHQLMLICRQGQIPFLHVREDNARAIALYERLGFAVSRPMNFFFLKRM